ncbi:GNAT family N-acetyltransferase [Streptomyces sp. NBC_00435]|uniref:GNAT family N-acetyltransferase n=1 Tax=Streptomyces sp. NBC_00435 TaxID=2903649 RepID=UPI002E1DBA0F
MNASTREPRLRVREMTGTDIDAVSAVRVAGWRHAYAGLMPQSYLDRLSPTEDAERRRASFHGTPHAGANAAGTPTNLVAEAPDGSVVGWAAYGPVQGEEAGEALPGEGELYALYARPDLIGTGIGRALMDEVLRRGVFPGLRLWVVEGNTLARRFYERAGFHADGAAAAYEVDGVSVPEVRYRRAATH